MTSYAAHQCGGSWWSRTTVPRSSGACTAVVRKIHDGGLRSRSTPACHELQVFSCTKKKPRAFGPGSLEGLLENLQVPPGSWLSGLRLAKRSVPIDTATHVPCAGHGIGIAAVSDLKEGIAATLLGS